MSRYFEIDGYWKDTKEVFSGYIVKETDEIEEDEDSIFIYGFSEVDLQYAVELGEHTIQDFVVTDYREVTLK